MTITTTKTLCDVTGKEVPTLRVQIGLSHQYYLSHEGAVRLLQGVSLPNSEARTHIIARCCPSDLPEEPFTGSEPLTWHFSDKAMRVHDSKIRNEAYSLGCEISVREYNDELDKARKQAARECLEIVCSISQREEPTPVTSAFRSFVRERITKAFGL